MSRFATLEAAKSGQTTNFGRHNYWHISAITAARSGSGSSILCTYCTSVHSHSANATLLHICTVPWNNKFPNVYSITLALFMSNSCGISTLTFLALFFCLFLSSHYRANLVLWQDSLIYSLFLLLVFCPSFMFNDTFSISVFVCDWQVLGNASIKFPTLRACVSCRCVRFVLLWRRAWLAECEGQF